jgi:radical SAM superfamily enzyme YgiQ (UPF0313 family)
VHHTDLSGVSNYLDVVRTYVSDHDTLTFGLTATSVQLPTSVEILRAIKAERPDARVILGGPHGTLVNAARRKEIQKGVVGRARVHFEELTLLFDTIVAGDGERAILHALKMPGEKLINADDPKSPLWLSKESLSSMPLPARDLVDLESYDYKIDGVPATTMIAQLGCPYGCGFCGGRSSPSLRQIRIRSVESVVAELRHIYDVYGFRAVMLYDDEVNVSREMLPLMRAITKLGDELGVEWRLRGFVKANLFTLEQAHAMFDAGFREILVGFESGSPRILRNINKRSTLEENTRCVEFARNAGLRVKALMSIGHPGESETTIRETEEWLLSIQPDSFDLTRITVYPGTPYFDDAVPHALLPEVWTYETKGDRLYSGVVDYLHDFIYYKGDRGDRMGLNKFQTFTDFLSSEEMSTLKTETEDRLREKLGQPYQVDVPGIQFEHSMGMGLPDNILRTTK